MTEPESGSSGPVLLDTNILVYAFDRSEPERHTAAREVVGDLLRSGRLVLSVQVLNEFYVVVTRQGRPQPSPGKMPRLL